MKNKPDLHDNIARRLTKSEAYRAQQGCKHIEGQSFYEGGAMLGKVECVAVSPHDAVNKWLFIHFYADCRNPLRALDFYSVPFYDVILIIRTTDDRLTYRNLDSYHPPQQQMAG